MGISIKNEGFNSLSIRNEMMSAVGVSVMQTIPFPSKLFARGDIQKQLKNSEYSRYVAVRLRVRRQVREYFYELWFRSEEQQIIQNMLNELQRAKEAAESLYRVGRGFQEHVLRAQLEMSRLREKLILSRIREKDARSNLAHLLNLSGGELTGTPQKVKISGTIANLPHEEMLKLLEEKNPELQAFAYLLRARKENLQLARLQYFPDFSLAMGWYVRDGFPDIWEARVGVTVPLYWWHRQINQVREASFEFAETEKRFEDLKIRLVSQLTYYVQAYDDSRRLLQLYQDALIPQASAAVESAMQAYQVGKLDFINLIEDTLTLLKYRVEYARVYADVLKLEAKLLEMLGEDAGISGVIGGKK